MKKYKVDENSKILMLFFAMVIVLSILIAAAASKLDGDPDSSLRNFEGRWRDSSGNVWNITDLRVNDSGESPIVQKMLPLNVSDSDSLCFESYNINLDVSVDGRVIYSFTSKENPTGFGYGTAYHEIGLSSAMAGKVVRISFERCNPDVATTRGTIKNMYLGEAVPYVHMLLEKSLPTIISSGLILFFGLIFLLISFVITDKERLPFDVAAMGISSIILGFWLLVLSNIFQLLGLHIYTARSFDRFLIIVAGVPLICFFNSLTIKKSPIYVRVEFWLNVLFVAALIILRYVAGVDMMYSFLRVLILYFVQIIIITVVIFVRHEAYCRKNGIVSGLRFYYIGITAFMVCGIVDYASYLFRGRFNNSYGMITSFGTIILIPVVLIQFIRWWTRDRQIVERERFTNRALQYALSTDSPEESIRLMLEFLGGEFKCRRAAVFEDMHNGRFNGSYAWFESTLEKASIDLLYIPYRGVLEEVFNTYRENGDRYVIRDVENYREANPGLYNMLLSYGIKNLVANPLEVDGEATGILVLTDLPADLLEEASSVAALTSYFLSQLILRRDEQKRMRNYTYGDSLSGAMNRRAYDEFVSGALDLSSPFGYMMSTIDGLDEINERDGFEAGDKMIAKMVQLMTEIFGKENVFRMAGSRFAAFGFETDEPYFRDDVARFERNSKEKGIPVLVKSAYCMNGTMDLKTVVKDVNDRIRAEQGSRTS